MKRPLGIIIRVQQVGNEAGGEHKNDDEPCIRELKSNQFHQRTSGYKSFAKHAKLTSINDTSGKL